MSKPILILLFSLFVFLNSNCQKKAGLTKVYPFSDPNNTGNWSLQEDVSDEFEQNEIDESKWFVQGTDSVYRSNFIGRAPSQFNPKNVRIEDGKLKLASKWQPDFDFDSKIDWTYPLPEDEGKGRPYENITTAAVIGKNSVHYSYMEIKCKAGDASVTSSFWALGNRQELDIFEFIGKPSKAGKEEIETQYMTNVIDWTKKKPEERRIWKQRSQIPWRVAGDFHVYACEWNENYLKLYADGKLIHETSKDELGEGWILTKPMWLWVGSEVFPWDGIPHEENLAVDFEIEYIRVWTKK
jgi:beta-glucanase (GH16 family)